MALVFITHKITPEALTLLRKLSRTTGRPQAVILEELLKREFARVAKERKNERTTANGRA
jgi:hypothetical protein